MTLRVVLLTPAPTAATRTAAFAADEPLDAAGLHAAQAATFGWHSRSDLLRYGPARRCRATAEALGLGAVSAVGPSSDPSVASDPSIADALDDCDHGRWSGRTLDEVLAEDPAGLEAWLTDPDAAPHDGETISALLARVAGWLDGLVTDPAVDGRRVVAVTHTAVVRAAVVHALSAPPASFWRIDAAPLTRTDLSYRPGGHWTVRRTAERLRPH
jgi:broad specificity phosphatase PhoE